MIRNRNFSRFSANLRKKNNGNHQKLTFDDAEKLHRFTSIYIHLHPKPVFENFDLKIMLYKRDFKFDTMIVRR